MAQTEQYIDALLRTPEKRRTPRYLFKDVRVFLNSLDRNLAMIRSAGIACDCGREETEQEIVLTIRLPKQKPA